MPVAKAPTAPYEVLWESAPTISRPGRAAPDSRISWWPMPSPTSQHRIPCRAA
jgi:hypothetical protein